MVTDSEGNSQLIPVVEEKSENVSCNNSLPTEPVRPKKTGSFNIIFRKVRVNLRLNFFL